MSFFASLFGTRPRTRDLAEPIRAAIEHWHAIGAADLRGPLADQAWLVVDVETSGLDVQRDRLIAIGAVIVTGDTLRIDQSFEVVLRQTNASRTDNILIHRITSDEQTDGIEPATALANFLNFSRQLPCVAFHAQFDQTMLRRAFEDFLGIDFSPPFIDLAMLAPALAHGAPSTLRSLDEWVEYFSIVISARHRAIADAVGTAQLLQVLLSRAQAQKFDSAKALFSAAHDQQWLIGLKRN